MAGLSGSVPQAPGWRGRIFCKDGECFSHETKNRSRNAWTCAGGMRSVALVHACHGFARAAHRHGAGAFHQRHDQSGHRRSGACASDTTRSQEPGMVGRFHSFGRTGWRAETQGVALRAGAGICLADVRPSCLALKSNSSRCRWTARWRGHAGGRRGFPGGWSTVRPAGAARPCTSAPDSRPSGQSIYRRG
jgi:hypothetical protein